VIGRREKVLTNIAIVRTIAIAAIPVSSSIQT
jgi:hypothetical protein